MDERRRLVKRGNHYRNPWRHGPNLGPYRRCHHHDRAEHFRLIRRAHHRTCGEVVASVGQHLCGIAEANVAPVHALLLFRVVLALD